VGDERISPTAHYTGYTWYRAGLSEPALATTGGALLYGLLRPIDAVAARIGSASTQGMLLSRHVAIDHLLTQAIERGEVGQVLEVAAGLSPRGRAFAARYEERGLVYVEGDLPGMAHRKATILRRAPKRPGRHHVIALDAFDPREMDALCKRHFDPARGTAIITEGLLMYFDAPRVAQLWRRFHAMLAKFEHGVYWSDLHLGDDLDALPGVRTFIRALSLFTRGTVHVQFRDETSALDALRDAGFSDVSLRDSQTIAGPLGVQAPPRVVRVLEARR
jgi:O-methyltransferase involved in polyketide biosynthesis